MLLWLPLVVGLGLVLTVFQAHMREEQPSWAVLLALSFAIVVFLALMPQLSLALQAITSMAREASIGSFYLNPVLKTVGVAYITALGVQISREAGEDTISASIELAGKLVILLIAMPLLQTILHTLFGILGF